ncbi:MAG TPA: sodium:solute symporter [bacterium]|nr:sodium:solute symporter [bacterium]
MNWTILIVFAFFFLLVTVMGFVAVHWQRGDLTRLDEWGLAGRRFGTVVTWFLLGGDLYTAYTFIAVPALVYGVGALGFFAVPYTIIVYPLVFVLMPRLWAVCRRHHYITPADFVRGRYGSSGLALAIAVTGILATMPYIALQLVGIQVVLATMGFVGSGVARDLPLIIAFLILAAYTYQSGLRAPALIALVKDSMIYITVIVAVIAIPIKLGGFGHIFQAAAAALPAKKGFLILPPAAAMPYASLALGSALALFMYPHAITAVLSSSSGQVVRRNAALLPAYSLMLGLLALFGYMAIAAGVKVSAPSLAVPALLLKMFPDWFVGFAFAAIAIGALVPAAVMSIAAANLFTRNIYHVYFKTVGASHEEATVAKTVSLLVKIGALAFVLLLPTQYAINLQLLGGVWILQTFPAIVFGLYTRWFHHVALVLGWLVAMVVGTGLAWSTGFKSPVYPLHVGGMTINAYAALEMFVLNILIAIVGTWILDAVGVPRGRDETAGDAYEAEEEVLGAPAVAAAR